jgi:hypothetical protein
VHKLLSLLCQIIDGAEQIVPLRVLAREAGLVEEVNRVRLCNKDALLVTAPLICQRFPPPAALMGLTSTGWMRRSIESGSGWMGGTPSP